MSGSMKSPRAALAVLFLVIFVDVAGFGIIIPFLPFWAQHFGASPDVVTLLMASYALMLFLMAPAWGWASDRWGRKPVLLISVAGSVISFIWLAFASSLWMLFAARIMAGAMGANLAVAQAYVADLMPHKERARGMGMVGAAFGIGFTMGPAIGGYLAGSDAANPDYHTAFLVGAAVSMLSFLLCALLLREPERHERAPDTSLRARLAAFAALVGHPIMAIPVIILGLLGFAMGGLESTFALWAERQLLWGPRETGFFLTYIGICLTLVQGGAVGVLVRRLGEVRLTVVGLIAFASGMVLIPASYTLSAIMLSGFLVAMGTGLSQPALNGFISRNTPAHMQGSVMGAAQSGQSFARIFAPAIAGFLFANLGRQSPYFTGAAIACVAIVLALGMLRLPVTQSR